MITRLRPFLILAALLPFCASATDTLVEWTFDNAKDGGTGQSFSTATTIPELGLSIESSAGENRLIIHETLSQKSASNTRKTTSSSDVHDIDGPVPLEDIELQFNPYSIDDKLNARFGDTPPDADYLEFKVSPTPGKKIRKATIDLQLRVVTGPSTFGGLKAAATVYTSVDGGSTWSNKGNGVTDTAMTGLSNLVYKHIYMLGEITEATIIRIVLSDNSGGSSADKDPLKRKAIYLDDIRLSGSVENSN